MNDINKQEGRSANLITGYNATSAVQATKMEQMKIEIAAEFGKATSEKETTTQLLLDTKTKTDDMNLAVQENESMMNRIFGEFKEKLDVAFTAINAENDQIKTWILSTEVRLRAGGHLGGAGTVPPQGQNLTTKDVRVEKLSEKASFANGNVSSKFSLERCTASQMRHS